MLRTLTAIIPAAFLSILAGCGPQQAGAGGGGGKGGQEPEKMTIRELVEHINAKGAKFRLMNCANLAFLTETPEDNDRNFADASAVPFLRADVDYVEVTRLDSQEEARQFVGSKEEKKYWHWRNFVFRGTDANTGASGKVKKLLGV